MKKIESMSILSQDTPLHTHNNLGEATTSRRRLICTCFTNVICV